MGHDFTVDALTQEDVWWFIHHQHVVTSMIRCAKCGLYKLYVPTEGFDKAVYRRSLSSFNPFESSSEPACTQ